MLGFRIGAVFKMNSTSQKLLKTASPYKGLFLFTLFCMFFSGIAGVLPSWFVKVSVDGITAFEKGDTSFSLLPKQAFNFVPKAIAEYFSFDPHNLHIVLPLIIVAVFMVEALFKFLYQYNSRKLGLLVVRDLREKFHSHVNKLALATQAKYDSGSLVSVITSDLNNMQSWLAESLMNMFNESFTAFFLFAWLLLLDWKLTLISLITIPMFAFPVFKLGKGIRSYSRQGQDYIGNIGSFISETLRNQKIIKAFNLEAWRAKEFKNESDILHRAQKKWVLLMAMVSPITNVLGALGISAILFVGLNSVKNGTLTVGEFSSFFVTTILLYDPIKRLGRVSTIVQSALGVADRVYTILDEEEQISSTKTTHAVINNGEIEFKKVFFSYKQSDGLTNEIVNYKPIFQDLSLHIPAKTSIALVGPSGGGKSSLVSMIPRFYEIDSGEILIDGVNIQELSLTELRKHIALVTQEPLLFTGTIRENILLGAYAEDPSESRIEAAADEAYVTEFTDSLEQGLDTHIGEMGSKLSIGQKQRISLARAFISNAQIVILDEPTSALDNESQEYIYKAINKLMETRTVIIIAHRLSTIEACDRIVYLQDGKIIESGSHGELLAKDSAYAALLK